MSCMIILMPKKELRIDSCVVLNRAWLVTLKTPSYTHRQWLPMVGMYLILLLTSGSKFWRQIRSKERLVMGLSEFYNKRTSGPNICFLERSCGILKELTKNQRFIRRLFDWVLLLWEPWLWMKFDYLRTTVINLKNYHDDQWGFDANLNTCPILVDTIGAAQACAH